MVGVKSNAGAATQMHVLSLEVEWQQADGFNNPLCQCFDVMMPGIRHQAPAWRIHQLGAQHPARDWILTRILWLSGCEVGFNRLGMCDTMRRYIYIHGTPDSTELGQPGSRGCIRMRNADIVELFDLVRARTEVELVA